MSGDRLPLSFVDTNVLVYAYCDDDTTRAPVAQELIGDLIDSDAIRTSTQVLQELYVVITRKVRKPVASRKALDYIDQLTAWPVVTTDYRAIRNAAELAGDHRLSFWDALIVVAAARSGAARLYSEDLQHGRTILGVRIVNPFRAGAPH